ncbi:head maturation protease, ClpP-related [Cerasicoccus frondis]|uniref:head maturation protease, ClpP-related n=1 Tax=Cerasicoccus frondis TaxID=490090 RepID=UPI002852D1C9|nr:head maturation protease, ClpP-related [Cerasicoccus frondis]
MKTWFEFKAKADDTTEIFIFDEIDPYWGIGAKQFIDELNAVTTANIDLRINSIGGSVFDGLAMANALKRHAAKVRVTVEGLAASIASVIAIAGNSVEMGDGAFLMIHNAWTFAWGNAKELRKQADDLDKINESIVSAYVAKTGLKRDDIAAMMDAETWLSAAECVEKGFADKTVEGMKAVALAKDAAKAFRNIPAALVAKDDEPPPAPQKQPPACNHLWRMKLREKRQALIEQTTN